jgi:hypothetical protein
MRSNVYRDEFYSLLVRKLAPSRPAARCRSTKTHNVKGTKQNNSSCVTLEHQYPRRDRELTSKIQTSNREVAFLFWKQ